ncbi:MAG: helix-turn-helix transcriptional regulator [Firmicutes bacterium]|nr:helix-turn-helix transcriptional regulator [Bacillota bacterium]
MKTKGWHFGTLRREAGLSQIELAHLAGYKTAYIISRIENDLCDIPEDKLEVFAKILGVSVWDLLIPRSDPLKR